MNAWLLCQQRRFMRQDGARYLRPDIGRYLVSERKWEGQPRVGAGGPDGGQFTFGVQSDEGSSEADRQRVQIDAPMWYDSDRDGAGEGDDYLAHLWPASSPPGMGHNQGPELDGAPEIPQSMPQTREERMAFVRAAATWLFGRSAIGAAAKGARKGPASQDIMITMSSISTNIIATGLVMIESISQRIWLGYRT